MRELPFSPDIQPFEKPVEVGDTNKIYFDPEHPDAVIRIPHDHEAKFLETDPRLIGIAEKLYRNLDAMGEELDIHVARHQFILAKETSDGPVKPMLLAERIQGQPLVPINKDNPKTLDALSRIAQLGLNYVDWIASNRPRSVVTDIFRPDQYLAQPGKEHDRLTLVDIESRLKDRERGKKFLDLELGMLVGPLRDTAHDATFNRYMKYALRTLKQDRTYAAMATLINSVVNAPDIYQQMSDDFMAGREYAPSPEAGERMRNTPLIISKELLQKFGIERL